MIIGCVSEPILDKDFQSVALCTMPMPREGNTPAY